MVGLNPESNGKTEVNNFLVDLQKTITDSYEDEIIIYVVCPCISFICV